MIIDQLPEISSVQTTDEMPIERGQTTYKTPVSKIFASPTLTGTPKAPTAGVSTNNTQIATTAFANRAANNAVSTFVRPNLLDNWYFVGGGSQLGYGVFPINQRGQTIYSNIGYSIDRWKKESNDGSVVIAANGVTISGQTARYIAQPVNGHNIYGKTITISALFADGTLVAGSGILPVDAVSQRVSIPAPSYDNTIVSCYKTPENKCAVQIFTNKPGDVTLAAIKLELGSTQTLAHQKNGEWVLNEIPDYETELLRCKTSTADPSDTYANGSVEFGNNIGIVQNTNTATQNISEGQYVIWHGALYTASAAIASGAALSSSNLTAVTGGGLNHLRNSISTITISTITGTTDTSGRIYIAKPPQKLLSIVVRSAEYWCVLRYHSTGTLVYIYYLGTFTPLTETSVTLDYAYLD